MRFLFLLPPLLLACKTTAVTTDAAGNTQTVEEADLAALSATVDELGRRLDDAEAELDTTRSELAGAQDRIADLEEQVAKLQEGGQGGSSGGDAVTHEELDALEYAVVVTLDALDARVGALESGLGALDDDYDLLSADVDALLAGSGNQVWTSSASDLSYLVTHGTDWGTVTSTSLTVSRLDPLVAWCQLQEGSTSSTGSSAYYNARVTLESEDGSWSDSSSTMIANTYATSTVATFTPPEAGTYTLACEMKAMTSLGLGRVDLVAIQAAATIDGVGDL